MSPVQKPRVQHQSSSYHLQKNIFSPLHKITLSKTGYMLCGSVIFPGLDGRAAGVINDHALFMFTRRRDTLAVNPRQVTRTQLRLMEQLCPLM